MEYVDGRHMAQWTSYASQFIRHLLSSVDGSYVNQIQLQVVMGMMRENRVGHVKDRVFQLHESVCRSQ